jgi:SSS family solute:Na+ symporter
LLKLSTLDFVLVLAYLGFLAVVGWRTRSEHSRDESSYLLVGRRMTLPAFVATLVSTWYGGILGVGEYSFKYGITNWLVFGVPYYAAALIYAFFIAGRVRTARLSSIPDQIESAYGKTPALIAAGTVFVMTVPAAYVLMIGVLLKAVFGGPLALWVILGTLFSTVYVAWGGFRAVVRTDVVQFVLMYLGFILLLVFSIVNSGGINWLTQNVPEQHLTWHGGLPVGAILVWYIIALSTLVDPGFHQRCSAAESPTVARRGILISVLLWVFFDAMTTLSGLYARAILPEGTDALLAYPLLAGNVLPAGITGLFLLSLISVILSTVDSFGFHAAQTLGRDVYARAKGDLQTWDVRRIQVGLVLSSLLAVVIALWKGSVVSIWYELGSVGTPVLLIPMLTSFLKKSYFTGPGITWSMIFAGTCAAVWSTFGALGSGYPMDIQPIFVGLAAGILPLAIDLLSETRRNPR